jgi:hypothetical protein
MPGRRLGLARLGIEKAVATYESTRNSGTALVYIAAITSKYTWGRANAKLSISAQPVITVNAPTADPNPREFETQHRHRTDSHWPALSLLLEYALCLVESPVFHATKKITQVDDVL